MSLINSTNKNETILTSIIGMERCDMVLQLAKLLRNAKTLAKKNEWNGVLILDNTYSQELYNMVAVGDTTSGVADYRGITIVSGAGYTPKEFVKYNHVIIFHGLNINRSLLFNSDNIYFITNYEKNLNKRIGSQIETMELPKKVTFICRDKAGHKVTEKNISHYAGVSEKNIRNQIVVPFDIKDYSLYLALTHNGTQCIKNYSEKFISALSLMTSEILNWDDKTTKKHFLKLVKKAR